MLYTEYSRKASETQSPKGATMSLTSMFMIQRLIQDIFYGIGTNILLSKYVTVYLLCFVCSLNICTTTPKYNMKTDGYHIYYYYYCAASTVIRTKFGSDSQRKSKQHRVARQTTLYNNVQYIIYDKIIYRIRPVCRIHVLLYCFRRNARFFHYLERARRYISYKMRIKKCNCDDDVHVYIIV